MKLNKTDLKIFSRKYFLQSGWLEFLFFMSDWILWYFYQTFHDHDTSVGMNGKTVNISEIFLIKFREWLRLHFYHRVIDGNMEMSSIHMGLLMVWNFSWNNYLHEKLF